MKFSLANYFSQLATSNYIERRLTWYALYPAHFTRCQSWLDTCVLWGGPGAFSKNYIRVLLCPSGINTKGPQWKEIPLPKLARERMFAHKHRRDGRGNIFPCFPFPRGVFLVDLFFFSLLICIVFVQKHYGHNFSGIRFTREGDNGGVIFTFLM